VTKTFDSRKRFEWSYIIQFLAVTDLDNPCLGACLKDLLEPPKEFWLEIKNIRTLTEIVFSKKFLDLLKVFHLVFSFLQKI